ncbi:MAG: CinA family protein [Arachnia sp.]
MLESAQELVAKLTQRSVTIATCESLTGGGLGSAITDVPGASAVYRGGLIVYARELKASLAGVDPELTEAEGVVNELTALQMAIGVQTRCDSDWAIATTGVAGPAPQDGADVGTVWCAVVGPGIGISAAPQYTELSHFTGDRHQIRSACVDHALRMVLRVI